MLCSEHVHTASKHTISIRHRPETEDGDRRTPSITLHGAYTLTQQRTGKGLHPTQVSPLTCTAGKGSISDGLE